jgi:hypothetical protein
MRFNVELEDGTGVVCARFQGWTDWLLNWPMRYAKAASRPEYCVFADEITLPGLPKGSVATWVAPNFFAGADLEWAARLFLHSQEMSDFWAINGKDNRRRFLVSRAAAKDAVRLWWARKYGGSFPHPAEFSFEQDTDGQPHLRELTQYRLTQNSELRTQNLELPCIRIVDTPAGTVAVASDVMVNVELSLDAASEGREAPVIIKSIS